MLRDSLINSNEEIETKGLEQLIRTTSNPNDAIELVKKMDKLTKCSKNNISEKCFKNLKVTTNLLAL